MWRPIPALEQSWLRTKATDLAAYLKIAQRKANSANDTLFADDKGEIAFLMPQFMPVRDDRFDYTRPVDGSDPATDWCGLHALPTLPSVINRRVGWAHNTNDWPWSGAGPDSPKAKDYPRYMDQVGGNARGEHADLLLTGKRGWTPERLRAAAYDPYLPAFARLVPGLVDAWQALPATDQRRRALAEPIAVLSGWDYRWSYDSVATSLAVFWGDQLWRYVGSFAQAERMNVPDYIAMRVDAVTQLAALEAATARLSRDFDTWRSPWRTINHFQRLDDALQPHFDDARRRPLSRSRPRSGAALRHSAPKPGRAPGAIMAQAGTASSRSWSSAHVLRRARSWPGGRAAIQRRRISPTRSIATRRADCGRFTLTRTNSRGTLSGDTIRARSRLRN